MRWVARVRAVVVASAALAAAGCGLSDPAGEPTLKKPGAASERSGGGDPFAKVPAPGDGGGSAEGGGEEAAGGGGAGADGASGGGAAGGDQNGGGSDGAGDTPSPTEVAEVEAARDAVSRLIDGLNRADPAVCSTLMTQLYVEAITGKEGQAAVRQCEHDVSSGSPRIEIDAFGPAEIKGSRAIIRVRLLIQNEAVIRAYDMLLGSDGAWRVDGQIG